MDGVIKGFRLPRTHLLERARRLVAVDDVTFSAEEGEILGIVGESGSGKSTLARLIMGIHRPDAGTVEVFGKPIGTMSRRDELSHRRKIQMIFQDPFSSLDPRMKVKTALAEPLRALGIDGSHDERVRKLVQAVQLPGGAAEKYPHEFSGGQLQRVAIARALAPEPGILVADEPVSALDLSVQAQILNLLLDLRDEFGLTILLIAHDLAVVRHMVDRVLVMAEGHVVESGSTVDVFEDPRHPYTERLLSAIIEMDGRMNPILWTRRQLDVAPKCPFADRCPYQHDLCIAEWPELRACGPAAGDHLAACHIRAVPPDLRIGS